MTDRPDKPPFHLVDRRRKPDATASRDLRDQLHGRRLPGFRDLKAAAKNLDIDGALETAINTALCVGAPLLITGDPGTGKTSVAHYLGHYFDLAVYPFYVKSTSTVRELQYDFDPVAYLHFAKKGEGDADRMKYTKKGALWQAYDDKDGAVLLIDEIDKASRDFPNDLLHELDQNEFTHPFDPDPEKAVRCKKTPIVIITSNDERSLPSAFLRRCIFHHIDLDEDMLRRAADARRSDLEGLREGVLEAAVERFEELRRSDDVGREPGTAEFLVWLAVLAARGTDAEAVRHGAWGDMPGIETLVKDPEDWERLEERSR